jgi:protein O-GlcNAc transferase
VEAFPISPFQLNRQQRAALELEVTELHTQAIAELRRRLNSEPSIPQLYIELAQAYSEQRRLEPAIGVLREGLVRCGPNEALYHEAIHTIADANRTNEALLLLRRAMQLFPNNRHFQLWEALTLRVLYDTEEEVSFYRARFMAGLENSARSISLNTTEERRGALDAVRRHLNFYLGYQGRDDRQPQEQYGQIVHRVVGASYPQWLEPRPMPLLSPGQRIRVGYISAHFRNHSITKLFMGWLQERNRQDFEVFVYHNGGTVDKVTEKASLISDHFVHIPGKFQEMCEAILADDLHIAVYLDVRHRRMAMMSSLRLAPVQCAAWAYPITSGSPMIDYFLSSDLMEPENGQEHYCECLVRLPGIGVCYPKPVIPRPLLTKSRSDFGIGSDRVVFLCCQSTFKYLPQHDDLFVEIAKRVPSSQFVFLGLNDLVAEDLRRRLDRAFRAEALEGSHYCLVLPGLSPFDYWNLNLVADVFLDTLEWSGGVTALEAVACDLPVVTLPGPFMRGRHSYGILTQLGITETIARDKKEYVEIAVRLGLDREWRGRILRDMKANHARLYSDIKPVRALEDLFRSVVLKRQGTSSSRGSGQQTFFC